VTGGGGSVGAAVGGGAAVVGLAVGASAVVDVVPFAAPEPT